MSNFFIYIYHLFLEKRWLFLIFLGAVLFLIISGGSRIRFVEDISGTSGKSGTQGRFDFVISHFRFTEKLVITLSLADTSGKYSMDDLCVKADSLSLSISEGCGEYINKLFYRSDDSIFPALLSCTRDHLPLFLDDEDYAAIDTMTSAVNIEKSIKRAYRQLISPASIAVRSQLLNDPLGIQGLALKKLRTLQGGDEYESYNGYVVSRDHRHLLILITPSSPPGETGRNGEFLKKLDKILAARTSPGKAFKAEYFGAAAVAVGNAERLKKDIILTLIIAFLAIFVLLGFYFSSLLVPILGLLPAVFGGGLAIAFLAFIKGSVSAIALGIGSVILGLIIDYSLYLINQYRRCGNVEETLREMSQSIVVCALTSAGAFLCLVFLESSVLHDLGWFASLSVAGAALFALVFLPQMFSPRFGKTRSNSFTALIDRIGSFAYERNIPLIVLLGLLVFASLFYFRKAGFEKDMNNLNYMEPGLRVAGENLERLSSGKLRTIYLVATGSNREDALRINECIQARLGNMLRSGTVEAVSGIRTLFLSDSISTERLNKWEKRLSPSRALTLAAEVEKDAFKTGFTSGAFKGFTIQLQQSYKPVDSSMKRRFEHALFSEWLNDQPGMSMVTSVARVRPGNAELVYQEFSNLQGVVAFDRQLLTRAFIERVGRDFNRLVLLSMLFVSLLLWISFGRIELAVFTAIPMYLSWLITLGFMGATGIRFNIFNIIVSSFIFGLGVDYSILMMRGIMMDFKFRTMNLPSYKVAVILSSSTTLFGVAALFTARHPALNSIALVSVFGIFILVIITFTIQPLVAGWFMTSRLKRNRFPITARIFVKTFITWGNIVFIALILAVSGSLMYFLIPLGRRRKENVFHKMFCGLSRLYIFLVFPNRRLYNPHGEDFRKPALIISNHQSLIETPAMLRLYPKIIILTNTWVYNSPVFGPVARLASFYNVDHGLDSIMDKLKMKVSEGYSILIFPEAHRSNDHRIQRFHRGAFYLAEQLNLDILPMMMFGSGDFLERGEFWGRPNMFRQKIYKRICPGDLSFGISYQERARLIRQFYIREYEQFRLEEGNASYFRRILILNYIYKGPVLEWYLKVKLRLENNYQLLNEYVPRSGDILDLGCGYGFVSYMLALTSHGRRITGVDYDEEKIRVAEGGFLKSDRIAFIVSDIRSYEYGLKDCIILSDVLHYIKPGEQEQLLLKCIAGLKPGGMVIIRDADENREKLHNHSKLTEAFSTGMKFNKTSDGTRRLYFISTDRIRNIIAESGFCLEIIGSKSYSSNTYYCLKKAQD